MNRRAPDAQAPQILPINEECSKYKSEKILLREKAVFALQRREIRIPILFRFPLAFATTFATCRLKDSHTARIRAFANLRKICSITNYTKAPP
jgi:hypothetical protein